MRRRSLQCAARRERWGSRHRPASRLQTCLRSRLCGRLCGRLGSHLSGHLPRRLAKLPRRRGPSVCKIHKAPRICRARRLPGPWPCPAPRRAIVRPPKRVLAGRRALRSRPQARPPRRRRALPEPGHFRSLRDLLQRLQGRRAAPPPPRLRRQLACRVARLFRERLPLLPPRLRPSLLRPPLGPRLRPPLGPPLGPRPPLPQPPPPARPRRSRPRRNVFRLPACPRVR